MGRPGGREWYLAGVLTKGLLSAETCSVTLGFQIDGGGGGGGGPVGVSRFMTFLGRC